MNNTEEKKEKEYIDQELVLKKLKNILDTADLLIEDIEYRLFNSPPLLEGKLKKRWIRLQNSKNYFQRFLMRSDKMRNMPAPPEWWFRPL